MDPSTTTDAGLGPPGRRSPRPGSRSWRRRVRIASLVLTTVCVLVLVVDAVLITGRVDRFPLDPRPGAGTTWVIAGLDSRADLPEGATAAQFGTTDQVPGARADVVLVLHRSPAGSTVVLSIPRDLVVGTGRSVDRLALRWLDGPQTLVDDLCRIGIPTDHLVTIDLRGFAAVVDAVGGLDVDVPEPVRDPAAGLEVSRAGRVHLDGTTALALVRSRHPEHLVGGRWTPAPQDADGRATAAGQVLSALADAARGSLLHPVRLQEVAWAASGAVTVDEATSAADLVGLAHMPLGPVTVLPVSQPEGDLLPRFMTHEGQAAITAAGLSCAD